MLEATEKQKKVLRKLKLGDKAADEARYAVQAGITSSGISGAYIQFGRDLQTYGLWEALLYVEQYEQQGEYKEGTAQKALDAAIAEAGI